MSIHTKQKTITLWALLASPIPAKSITFHYRLSKKRFKNKRSRDWSGAREVRVEKAEKKGAVAPWRRGVPGKRGGGVELSIEIKDSPKIWGF